MNRRLTYSGYTALAVLSLTFAYGCGDESSELDTGAGGEDAGSTGNQGGSGAGDSSVGGTFGSSQGGSGGGQGGNCVDLEFEGEEIVKPADIIIAIDNSGSMGDEIASVEQNLNTNFAQIIGNSGIDYQVIMVTDHGTDSRDVCIGTPLSSTNDCSQAPGEVAGQFYHYDVHLYSHDSLCVMLDTLYGSNSGGQADEWGLHPNGWSKWLRTEAVKIFLEITDDDVSCTWNGTNYQDDTSSPSGSQQLALDWDKELLGLAPGQFGSVADRNYLFYSIIGLPAKANATEPYEPVEPVTSSSSTCSGAVDPGWGYQWLSKGTDALRFPVCSYQSYDAVFQAIAAGVVEGAAVPCEFELPEPPEGQELVLDELEVEYTPGDDGPVEIFEYVASSGACNMTGKQFYIENDKIVLCPETCDKISSDNNAEVKVIGPCLGTME